VNSYAQNNLVLPLDDIIDDKADFNQAALNSVSWDGKVWAIPYRIESRAVIYNRADFKAAGLDPDKPPQTWPELTDAASKITEATGKSGYAIVGGGEVSNIITSSLPFLWMNGGGIISSDLKTAIVNEPASIEAVTYYTDFYKKGLSPASTLENDGNSARRLFIADSIAAYLGGQFDIPTINKENPDLDVGVMMIPHPEGKQTAAVLAGWSYVVPKDAKNPDDAKKLLKFLNTTENQAFFTYTFPARISSLSAERFQDPALAPFKGMLDFGRPVPSHKNWVQIMQAYYDGIQRILLGDQTVQESMDQANDEIQALLDR
jgi:multiple sugar transport system substrate-binding protein